MHVEVEVFLSLVTKSIDSDASVPNWHQLLALEVCLNLCTYNELPIRFFEVFDRNQQSANVFSDLMDAIGRLISSSASSLSLPTATTAPPDDFAAGTQTEQYAISASGSSAQTPTAGTLGKTRPARRFQAAMRIYWHHRRFSADSIDCANRVTTLSGEE